jgi:hypothetical protein
MFSFLTTPHFWTALGLIVGIYAPIVPEVWRPYLTAAAAACSGLTALLLQWSGSSGTEIERLADALVAKTPPPPAAPDTASRA